MRLRGADLLARTLAAAGTRHVFTLSGNHVMPVFDAALDARLELLHVRHEAAAVHMADAWGRLTGGPGVALVTGGPGHANALSALYTALEAQSPLLLLSGHAPLDELGRGAFQEMAQAELARPLTKASWTARSAATLAGDVARALSQAASGRPGPVHLSLPTDVLEAHADAAIPQGFEIEKERIEAGAAERLLAALLRAKRPLILTGPAALHANGRGRIERLEEASGVPVIAMESPRGVNDPSLGRLAGILKQADVVLLLGKRKNFTLGFGRAFAEDCRVLEAALDLESLAARAKSAQKGGWRDEVRAALDYRPPQWASVRSKPEGPLHPVELCREVAVLLDSPEAVLVCDGGEFGQWAQACLGARRRLINGPAGAIGSALPFAAAAKLAFPDAPVVALLGDGTFGFHMSELDTALRYGLSYIAVVGNDACWNAEHQIQLRAYGPERAHGCELLPTRYGAASAALGVHGEDVYTADALKPALERAARSGKPACVNVMIERLAAPRY
jgi:acetolactate synthase I/II/III large subunit